MRIALMACAALALAVASTARADLTDSLKAGKMDIQQAGPLAFGPDGVLFVGDTTGGAVYAIATGDTKGDASKAKVDVKGIDGQVAAMLGTTATDILINNMAVNPASGKVYLSVARGKGADSKPAIVVVDGAGKLSELNLTEAKFSKAALSNLPAATPAAPAAAPAGGAAAGARRGAGGGGGAASQRSQSITGMAYTNGKVIVAGLSNEEFASKLRTIDFPFKGSDVATSVEIYHDNHDAVETRSPVRTFVTVDIKGTTNVLAGYTCTPLVLFSMDDLKGGAKVRGKTIAELGAGNNPLDMITYKKDGKDFLLVNNSRFGVMKLGTDGLASAAAITTKQAGTAGIKAETIAALTNVAHLDKLNEGSAVLLVKADGGTELRTIALP